MAGRESSVHAACVDVTRGPESELLKTMVSVVVRVNSGIANSCGRDVSSRVLGGVSASESKAGEGEGNGSAEDMR